MAGPSMPDDWYVETCHEAGAAFGLAIEERLYDEQSEYQRVEVYQTTHFGRLMTLDGLVMLTQRDHHHYHEMLVHPALFLHPQPQRVLVVGGGDCGTLTEVLKHDSVQAVVQVELDPAVTRAAQACFPELHAATEDPRVTLEFGDGIAWLRDAAAGSFDVILIDSTDPVGPAEGLFTTAFYGDCHRALTDAGVLALQSESPLLHEAIIRRIHGNLAQAGFGARALMGFPQTVYPSGWWSITQASRGAAPAQFRAADAAAKTFATRYYNAELHRGALAVPEFLSDIPFGP